MNYRRVGGTDLIVSEVAFGAWGIGGAQAEAKGYGETKDRISELALLESYELGVNLYDTAPLYGYGHSENLIGKTLSHRRQDIILSSKVGYLDFNGNQDFSIKHINYSLEKSLSRLKTDYLDIYQLHDPPINTLLEDDKIFETMESLKKKGLIRAIGISTRSTEDDFVAIENFDIDTIQLNFNLVDQRIVESGLIEKCQDKGIGIFVRTPLCFGFLTGDYRDRGKFSDDDHRSKWSKEQIKLWANASQLFASNLSGSKAQTNAQIALRFCLSYTQITSVIPGMLTPEHVQENVKSSKLGGFKRDTLKMFNRIYQDHQFYVSN